jgi:MoaA/NifB/PqqE/SkfB family radical SAM enzyme
MSVLVRGARHLRLTLKALGRRQRQTPPFLILFINSTCNLTCEHCFYWRHLNRRDDLSYAEFAELARELGRFDHLNLSGGEPFLRPDLAAVCDLFIEHNGVRHIAVPTNGYYTERTSRQLRQVLRARSLKHFVCELSLDGMPAYHDRFRGNPKSFAKALETYDMLAELHKADPRVRVHAISTATGDNMEELHRLTEFLYQRCPAMDHHNLAIIRGDRKNPSLQGPALERYERLHRHVAAVWRDREKGRLGAVVEPLLQWAKCQTIRSRSQYVPCTAGNLTGVVYANGDVAVCETHPPLGNLREKSFFEIWESDAARKVRARIRAKKCYCTNEVFLWPGIVFQPLQLAKALLAARPWQAGRRPAGGTISLPVVR